MLSNRPGHAHKVTQAVTPEKLCYTIDRVGAVLVMWGSSHHTACVHRRIPFTVHFRLGSMETSLS